MLVKKTKDRPLGRYFLSKFKEMSIEPIPLGTWKKNPKID